MKQMRILIRVTLLRFCVNIFLICVKFCDGKPTISALSTSSASTTTIESTTQIPTTTEKSPMEIADGQSVTDKLKVMRLLSELEKRLEAKFQIQRNDTESRPMPYIYEGDIILTPVQATEILESTNKRKRRKLHANLTMLWNLPIHYRFDGTHNADDMMLIRRAIKYWESKTCIKFLEVQSNSNISNTNNVTVVFRKSDINSATHPFNHEENECWSYIGRNEFPPSYEQPVTVSTNCLYDGSILHEIGHLIGFWHEHERPDRDDYVTIFMHNIIPHKEFNFNAETWKTIDSKSVPYDVGSVMHYTATAFSVGDLPTIMSRNYLLPRAMGQRYDLSFYDVKLANLGYCKNICQTSSLLRQCMHEGYQDPNDCYKCRCPEGLSGQYCEEAAPPSNPLGISVDNKKSLPTWYDSHDCGGTITLTLNKPVDFGISTYKKLRKCNWFFKAPTGTNIDFIILDKFLNYEYCTPDPKYPCRDFVEVKYNHSLATTGARLCCSNNMTSHPITSQGNEMLVLFRGYGNGEMGFNATVLARPCGGCLSTGGLPSTPCSRRVNFTCELTWTEKRWNACKNGIPSNDCGLNVNYNRSRPSTCYRDEMYCCAGYVLKENKCIATLQSLSTRSVNQNSQITPVKPTEISTYDKSSTSIIDGWSPWSNWTSCSQPCGGCGTQARSKSCSVISICGDKPDQTEIRSCNLHLCNDNTSRVCSRLETVTTYCGFFWPTVCTKNTTKTYLHRGPCCCEYDIQNNICVELKS